MEKMETITEALAEQIEAIGNLLHAKELAKENIKKMQREWAHERKQQIATGWNKPIPSKPIGQQKVAPYWYRTRSFCKRRRPPDPKC